MMAFAESCTPIFSMKLRSILILENGKSLRYERDEYPVPKSSNAIWTPIFLSFVSVTRARSESEISAPSVISSSNLVGASPVPESTDPINAGKSSPFSDDTNELALRMRRLHPCLGQRVGETWPVHFDQWSTGGLAGCRPCAV